MGLKLLWYLLVIDATMLLLKALRQGVVAFHMMNFKTLEESHMIFSLLFSFFLSLSPIFVIKKNWKMFLKNEKITYSNLH
jgi:hypothetical protein